MSSSEYVLEMSNISKAFSGVKALDGVSLKVRPGTVHALVGENGAGKSTLMKCLFGLYSLDEGEITFDGQRVAFANTKEAIEAGISMIQQEPSAVPQRSVLENFWLGRFPIKSYGPVKVVDEKKMYADCKAVLDDLDIRDMDPYAKIAQLSASKVQLVQIAEAVSYHSKVIIMDEPTSSLTEDEVQRLFGIIRRFKREGVAIIYISHRIDEILAISDEVTILRDGKVVGSYPASELTNEKIISQMVGRTLKNQFPPRLNAPSDKVVLMVDHVTSIVERSFRDVSFEVHKGEIFGIGGLVGAQRSELVEALFGLRQIASGSVSINGKKAVITNPRDAKSYRMALVTEERRATGIFPLLSILDNTMMASLQRYSNKLGVLDRKRGEAAATAGVEALRVKTPSMLTHIQDLSGGNQQKVILARWLVTDPEILILDEPTRGIDVGAKFEIYTIMADLAKSGKAIIMISSELPELIAMSDRVMVMCEGKVTNILDRAEATEERVMTYATMLA